ncbi:MAG TPA: hypothetical protein VMK42_07295 [Anaeromyxobacteraceae bacterium]|nr:hypothetical protein [Anaeromyxobacteraceae bacterium]
MTRRLSWAAAVAAVGMGCATGRVVDRDLSGPQGEHLVQLECPSPDPCLALARQTCRGDFEVVSEKTVWSGFGHAPPGSAEMMWVRCKTGPVEPPAGEPPAPRGESK